MPRSRAEILADLEARLGPDEHAAGYTSWLRAQPVAVQNDVLGPRRAAGFRAGALTVRRYTDHGAPLTLEQLDERRPEDTTHSKEDEP